VIRWPADLSPDVRSLLERERSIAVLPAAARARALSRARAALATGVATRSLTPRAPSTVRWAAAAGLACMASVASGAAAYMLGVRARPSAPPVVASPPKESPPPHGSAGDEPLLGLLAAPMRETSPAHAGAGAVRVEMRLLEQARVAFGREDFVRAIELLAEHARRFRKGRLVEEREALRIKSLAGLGRRTDARRAATQFEENFPRSPLLSAIRQIRDSEP
jgi:hypothetical protein